MNEMEEQFSSIFSVASIIDEETIGDKRDITNYSNPVERREVDECLKSIRCSAPGPDGFKINEARKVGTRSLELLFNVMLLLKYTPKALRVNRTRLISKKKTSRDPKNWRPITISSIILRILHRILAKRMTSVNLMNCQRRFFSGRRCIGKYHLFTYKHQGILSVG